MPICSHRKSVRDDDGQWVRMDSYLHRHSEAEVSHGICPSCLKEHHPRLFTEEELDDIDKTT